MFSLFIFAFVVICILLGLMWAWPAFKDRVATSWGFFGAGLIAALAWLTAWFTDAPVVPLP